MCVCMCACANGGGGGQAKWRLGKQWDWEKPQSVNGGMPALLGAAVLDVGGKGVEEGGWANTG